MPRIVIDTCVLVAALRSRRGASFRLLQLVEDPRWELNLSVALVLEYEAIGKREAGRIGIPLAVIDDIVDRLCCLARCHAIPFRLRPELRDANDEFILELAFVGRCDYIVTHNVRDFLAARRFGIRVVTPGDFLGIMGVKP